MKKAYGMIRAAGIASMVVLFAIAPASLLAQTTDGWSSWWYGFYGGINYNILNGEIHDVNQDLTVNNLNSPVGFTAGSGIGLALGGIIEFNNGGLLGGNIMIGYDSRSFKLDNVGQQELTLSPAYVTIEPNLRLNLGGRALHVMVGPSFGINVSKGFDYVNQNGIATSGEMQNVRSLLIGMQAGAGYDIPLIGPGPGMQMVLTPFAQFRLGQEFMETFENSTSPRPNSTAMNTFRFGVQLKFGSGAVVNGPYTPPPPQAGDFTLRAPDLITDSRRMNETFPLRNYIFFDAGSTEVPTRYSRISRGDAGTFTEEQLLKPSVETGRADAAAIRSRQQMEVYHHVMNIIGDRMKRNPSATIELVGAANGDAAAGKTMADKVKDYMVNTFGIDAGRITTKGQPMPPNKSGSGGSQGEDQKMIAAENNRVTITGPNEILRPVYIQSVQEQPLENDVVISIPQNDNLASWSVEVLPSGGATSAPIMFGPYRNTSIARIDSKQLLGAMREGRFSARITTTMKDGSTMTTAPKEFRLVRGDQQEQAVGERYSILFEFDESKTVQTYEEFLSTTVVPAIPDGASVIIHGHTDIIGEPEYNAKLSQRRAEETQRILTSALTEQGKTVTFDTYGFGEDERRSPFNNTMPEQRYYNRSVVIEVVPSR